MPETIASQESVILMLDKDTQQPLALVRKNGSIEWFMLEKATWDDLVQITGANKVN